MTLQVPTLEDALSIIGNVCNNAVVAVEPQVDGPLEEEKEPMTLQVPTLEDALSIIGSADTASC